MKIRTFMKASIVALLLSGVVVSGYADSIVIEIQDALAGRTGHISTNPAGFGTAVNTATTLDAGIFANNFQAHPVFVFQMTGVTVPADITNANFSVSLVEKVGTFTFSTNAHVIRTADTSTINASDYETSAEVLMSGFNIPDDAVGNYDLSDAGQSTLTTWLHNNWVKDEYVFIGLKTNPLTLPDGTAGRLYRYGGANNVAWSADSTDAQLTISVIPEPATMALMAFFGGAVLFIRRRLTT